MVGSKLLLYGGSRIQQTHILTPRILPAVWVFWMILKITVITPYTPTLDIGMKAPLWPGP